MNLKIKLTISGKDLEITMEEARDLQSALNQLLQATCPEKNFDKYWREAQPAISPLPYYRQTSPSPLSPVTCDSGVTFLDSQSYCGSVRPARPVNIGPMSSPFSLPPNTSLADR